MICKLCPKCDEKNYPCTIEPKKCHNCGMILTDVHLINESLKDEMFGLHRINRESRVAI